MTTAAAHSALQPLHTGVQAVDEAHAHLRAMDGALRAARAAGQPDDVLRLLAGLYVEASHDYQLVRHGRVRVRLSVGAVLRRG